MSGERKNKWARCLNDIQCRFSTLSWFFAFASQPQNMSIEKERRRKRRRKTNLSLVFFSKTKSVKTISAQSLIHSTRQHYDRDRENFHLFDQVNERIAMKSTLWPIRCSSKIFIWMGQSFHVGDRQRKAKSELVWLNRMLILGDIELCRGIPTPVSFSLSLVCVKGDMLTYDLSFKINHGDFILILRLDGRIVVISEEAEHHLGKSMVNLAVEPSPFLTFCSSLFQRSLYSQCINMFECLDRADGDQLRSILAESERDQGQEHQLVCTFRLPKGKRPSRINEDIKVKSFFLLLIKIPSPLSD